MLVLAQPKLMNSSASPDKILAVHKAGAQELALMCGCGVYPEGWGSLFHK